MLDFDRIAYLLNPEQFADTHVTIVGLGSGGAVICDHLAMNGIRYFDLYDPETLDGPNLVKHPRMRKDLGRFKVEIQKEWIEDRNPQAVVNAYAENVMKSAAFDSSIRKSDLVLICPDKNNVREFVSDCCVKANVPFVIGSVFRTGVGGDILSCVPGVTGCYRCLQLLCESNQGYLTDEQLGLTRIEEEHIYGLGETEYRASGLSIDIQMIALIAVRMGLSLLLRGKPNSLPEVRENWIVFGNRPFPGFFKNHFQIATRAQLKPREDCNCRLSYNHSSDSAEG